MSNAVALPRLSWLTLLSICFATFLMPLSLSSVNIALPYLGRDLDSSALMLSWIPAMSLLGTIAVQLPAGKVADILGRKRVFLCGVCLFALASLSIVFVEQVEWVLLVRLLQGISGALIFGTGMAMVTQLFPEGSRGLALGLVTAAVYAGLTCGPIIGGFVTEYLGWRYVFYVPVPFALFSFIMVKVFVEEQRGVIRGRFDLIGSLLFILASSLFFTGVAFLPDALGWGLSLAGLSSALAFVRHQRGCEHPLINIGRIRSNFLFYRSIQTTFFTYFAIYPIQFILSIYLQVVRGLTPFEAGQLLMLQPVVLALCSPFSGRLSDRYEPRYLATLGCLILFLGALMLCLVDEQSGLGYIGFGLLAIGFGYALFSPPNVNAAMSSVPLTSLGIGSSLINISRSFGNITAMSIVVLLSHQMIGSADLGAGGGDAVMRVTHWIFTISAAVALIAAALSYSRGNMRATG